MVPLRRLALAVWLAAALLVAQQAALAHDLAHAQAQLSHKGSKPGSQSCDQCFACAQLAGAMGVSAPSLPPPSATGERVDCTVSRALGHRVLLAFRSRAPPASS